MELLSELGYRVLKASDATAALAIIDSGLPVDLLFTDVVMPGPLRSPELARKARERLPNIAVLFTSGYTENAIVHGGRLDEGVNLISKPYSREALARKIRHVLAAERQRGAGAWPVAPPAPAPQQETPSEGFTILFVEDDDLIRLTTAEMLKDLGHIVVEASGADEALVALQTCVFDVLITDLELPGVSGEALVNQARQQQPGLGVIFATGSDFVPPDGLADAIVLRKPYDVGDLAATLRGLRRPTSRAVEKDA
ncbi:response regulator [Phenylobacterium sp. J426]|nr:response regulator [Phenylobacterium sp. J426]